MAALCLMSCRNSKISMTERVEQTALQRLQQSASEQDRTTYRLAVADLQPVPRQEAHLQLTRQALDSIPDGQALSRREGSATASICRINECQYLVTATCDSMLRQLMLYEQAYDALLTSYEQLSDSLRTSFDARTEERKRTKPPEWALMLAAVLRGAIIGGADICGVTIQITNHLKRKTT